MFPIIAVSLVMALDKVRICVDELGVVPDPGNKEPIRALSLNRLDISEREVEPLYKCPSFPRLSQRHHPSHRHLRTRTDPSSLRHADSVSVQPTLSPGREDELGALPRCSSARAVGEKEGHLPALEYRPGSSNLLSPPPVAGTGNPVARSTSCPAIHPNSPHAPRSGIGSPHHGSRQGSSQLPSHQEPPDDVDLHGEVINDLPIEASQTFPDFFPLPVDRHPPCTHFEEHPMHTRRIRERTSIDPSLQFKDSSTWHAPPHQPSRKKPTGAAPQKDGFLNIGDIPSALAQKVILEQDSPFMLEHRDKIQVKCMKWLNTLNNNNSSNSSNNKSSN